MAVADVHLFVIVHIISQPAETTKTLKIKKKFSYFLNNKVDK